MQNPCHFHVLLSIMQIIWMIAVNGHGLFSICFAQPVPNPNQDSLWYQVTYDSTTHMYIITPYYQGDSLQAGPPYYLTTDEYLRWREEQLRQAYLQQLRTTLEEEEDEEALPQLPPIDASVNKIFGSDLIQIKPSGQVSFTAGYRHTKTDNPLLPETYRSYGQPDFDADLRFNITGSIGQLMNVNFNFDSRAQFDYENQLKIKYTGKEHHIIQNIEAGNISFSLPTSLITGVQNLIGLKTQLQFGKLTVDLVAAEQRSEARTLTFQGGARIQTIEIRADEYDENRHYFLAHAFRNNYEPALQHLPLIRSPFRITRIEIWVTDRTGRAENARDVVALLDLGEPQPYRTTFQIANPPAIPSNQANNLYAQITALPGARSAHTTVQALRTLGLETGTDFEKFYARKLSEREYTLHPELGFVSLHIALQPNDILAVAFEYTYNGKTYRVGEFSDEIPPGPENDQVLFVKLLKLKGDRPDLPLWDLMMKNIYSIGAWQISPEDFRVDIYYLDAGGGYKRYLPEGPLQGIPLLQVLGLDQLDRQQRRRPDGTFDFLPGITIDPQRGWLIFPVLEPFGATLRQKMANAPHLWGKYVFHELYDSTITQARQYPAKNRYLIRVQYKAQGAQNEIDLGRMNIPRGSVRVTAGGRVLQEGTDYTVDYMMGKVRIINPAIIESGQPIQVSFESQDFIGFQRKFFLGTRLTYWVNDNLTIGGTWLRLSKLPFTPKVDYQNIPYTNEIIGLDLQYQTRSLFLTHLINKLPTIESRSPSQVQFQAEVAHFIPREPRALRLEDRKRATIYLDDFEGARQYYELRLPVIGWQLASPPHQWYDLWGNRLFPETDSINSLAPNKNRAHLAWYTIDPVFYQNTARTPDYIKSNPDYISDPYTHEVYEQEIFPEKESEYGTPVLLQTLDLAYYPMERGPYNFDTRLRPDGKLQEPRNRWAGIQQPLYITDFERNNIEYIELWLMDPFIHNPFSTGGYLYIHLGDISEDVLPDGRLAYENGLPRNPAEAPDQIDTTIWGIVPAVPPITRTFDNDPETRTAQDVGLDGLNDQQEATFRARWLNAIQPLLTPDAYNRILEDPSADNFRSYLDPQWDDIQADIITRYKYYALPDGNSPVATAGADIVLASSNIPSTEDLDEDNTLDQTEAYFQYVIEISPSALRVGNGFVTDMVETDVDMPNGTTQRIRWYQIRIPIQSYQRKVNNPDLRAISFIRLLLTGFDTTVILRFGRIALVGSTWRIYQGNLQTPGEVVPIDDQTRTSFEVTVVNIEENSQRQPIPYVLPPGIERERLPSGITGTVIQQNEQSLALRVCNLNDGERKAVYRNMTFDLRQFRRLKLFIHAEARPEDPGLQDGELVAFLRLGTDFQHNYYEIRVPLHLTPWGTSDRDLVWHPANRIDISLDSLVLIKRMRDQANHPITQPFLFTLDNGHQVVVVGRPDLGRIQTMMLGIYNPPDDGQPHCAEVWFNELRVFGLQNYGGTAFRTSGELNLANVIQIGAALEGHTPGFGTLNQTIMERSQDYYLGMSISATIPLHELLGIQAVTLPVYLTYTRQSSLPRYHPFESDLVMKDLLQALPKEKRDSLRALVRTLRQHRGLTLTGIRFRTSEGWLAKTPLSLTNWNFGFTIQERLYQDPFIALRQEKQFTITANYAYAPKIQAWQPFQYRIKSRSRWLRWLREWNFTPLPQQFSWQNRLERRFQKEVLRPLTELEIPIPPYYDKTFTWTRNYTLRWNPFRSLTTSFQAQTQALILEPPGNIDTREERRAVRQELLTWGTPTQYQHTIQARYQLPFDKFPILEVIRASVQYSGGFQWKAWSPTRQDSLLIGSTIANNRTLTTEVQFRLPALYQELHRLYWTIRYRLNPPKHYLRERARWEQRKRVWLARKKQGKDPGPKPKKPRYPPPPPAPKSKHGKKIQQFAQGFRQIRITYTRQERTTIPGYALEPRWAGMDSTLRYPGLPFLAGQPPDTSYLTELARAGVLVRDPLLAAPFEQQREDRITANASFSFFRMVSISLNASLSKQTMYQEIFKDTIGDGTGFAHLSPYQTGNFSVSTWALGSMIGDPMDRKTYRSPSFERFRQAMQVLSQRLGKENPYSTGPIDTLPQFWEGYGPTATQVLIPAFLAAYLKKDPYRIPPRQYFLPVPLPGWTIRLQILHHLPGLKKLLRSSSISHSYKSTYSVGQFKTSFYYQEVNGYEAAIHPVTGNFIPPYEFTGVQIEEHFSPLIGIQTSFRNGMTFSVQMNQSRILKLSFANYQLVETRQKNLTLNFSGKLKNVKVPRLRNRRLYGREQRWVRLRQPVQVAIRGSYTYMLRVTHQLYQDISLPTQGMITFRFTPSLSYEPIKNLRLRFFSEYTKSIPLTSTSYPNRTFFIGVTATYTLSTVIATP